MDVPRVTVGAIVAGVVGVIIVVSLDLAPAALVDVPSAVIALGAFGLITFLNADVALIALGAMVAGVGYAAIQAVR